MNSLGLSPYRIMWLFVMFDLPVGPRTEVGPKIRTGC